MRMLVRMILDMDDATTITWAAEIEADRWARKGYRLTRYDGPVKMTADELAAYARTGRAPARK